jgi:flagellar hook-associated protein 1 FlgK
MAGDLFGSGVSALFVNQRALMTTSHNIANVNTEGFTRQRVEQSARNPQFFGSGYLGSGVQVDAIRRVYDEFATAQVRFGTSSFGELNTYYEFASQVDNLLADPSSGLIPGVNSFFNAVQNVADDPASKAAREVMLSEANSLEARFGYIDRRLEDLGSHINSQISNTITEINDLSAAIAEANRAISQAVQGGGQSPNDLLDRRDQLINELSQRISVSVVPADDSTVSVFVGNGQTLVVGVQPQRLAVIANAFDPEKLEVGYQIGGAVANITNQISGGSMTGLIRFRDEILEPARNSLGQVAMGIAKTFNDQHRLGMDVDGLLGGNFFADIASTSPQVISASAATVTARVIDVNALTNSDYRLLNTGATYTLTRLSDGTVYDVGAMGFPAGSVTVDGVQLSLAAGVIAVGDEFLVRPTRLAARAFDVAILDRDKIAAAAPIRADETFGNTGAGVISQGSVNSPNNRVTISFTAAGVFNVVDNTTGATLASNVAYGGGPQNVSFNGWTVTLNGAMLAGDSFVVNNQVVTDNSAGGTISPVTLGPTGSDPNLTDPVTITFTGPNTFDVTGATTGSPTVGLTYVPGQPISFNGWTVNISGNVATGDSFTVGPNTGGVGDNRNSLELGALQGVLSMANGSQNYQGVYGQMVVKVGAQTHSADYNKQAQQVLLDNAIDRRESVSGVNLDEEAANLVKYQQAYQAAAQVIATSSELFDTLLAAMR